MKRKDANKTANTFITVLRNAVTGADEKIDFSDVDYESLYSISVFHDLTHLVYYELKRRNVTIDSEYSDKFKSKFELWQHRTEKRRDRANCTEF